MHLQPWNYELSLQLWSEFTKCTPEEKIKRLRVAVLYFIVMGGVIKMEQIYDKNNTKEDS